MATFFAPSSPGGSSSQLQFNNNGTFGGVSTLTVDGSGNLTFTARWIQSTNGAASSPAHALTGTWFTGGTTTTTKPQLLIEPAGTTSTSWSTAGTGLGVNAASGFTGNLLDLQVGGSSRAKLSSGGGFNVNNSSGVTLAGFIGTWNSGAIGFQAGASFSDAAGLDTMLRRDSAGVMALRNDLVPQAFRVYNTYTSNTNYELGKLEWSSNVFRIGTEKGSAGGTARSMELHLDGTPKLHLFTNNTIVTAAGVSFFSSADVRVAAGGSFYWDARTNITSPANGRLLIGNFPQTDFDRMMLGGTTSGFPALKRSGATLQARLADDSGYTTFDAEHRLQGTSPASATATGTAGDIRSDADYIYICTATNTWKRAAIATW